MTDQETIMEFIAPGGEINPENLITAAQQTGKSITIYMEDDNSVRCGCTIGAGRCDEEGEEAFELKLTFCDDHAPTGSEFAKTLTEENHGNA